MPQMFFSLCYQYGSAAVKECTPFTAHDVALPTRETQKKVGPTHNTSTVD